MARVSAFPPFDLDEALLVAKTIWKHNAGKPMRRLTIFDTLNRSPTSSTSRALVTASSGYGLTQGGYTAETLSLTDRGRAIVENNDNDAKIQAVLSVTIFSSFFEHYRNSIVPSDNAAIDYLKSQGISATSASSCFQVLLKSGEQVALIQEISGSKRIVSAEHALEKLQNKLPSPSSQTSAPASDDQDKPMDQPLPRMSELNSGSPGVSQSGIPSLHIDIQIHIAADAQPEQIEKIFESMAKYLYGKN